MVGLSHFDDQGQAHMVDVSQKAYTCARNLQDIQSRVRQDCIVGDNDRFGSELDIKIDDRSEHEYTWPLNR